MTFNKWIDTFLAEKGIDLDLPLKAEGKSGTNFIPVQNLVEAMKQAPKHEQDSIKNTLVAIDVKAPGQKPVIHLLEHLAQAIAI